MTGTIFCQGSGDPTVRPSSPSVAEPVSFPTHQSEAAEPMSVEGALRYVFNNGKALLLSFADPHRGHFKALIPRDAWARFPGLHPAMGRNRAGCYREGQRVRITGQPSFYQGNPAIYVTGPDQCTVTGH